MLSIFLIEAIPSQYCKQSLNFTRILDRLHQRNWEPLCENSANSLVQPYKASAEYNDDDDDDDSDDDRKGEAEGLQGHVM